MHFQPKNRIVYKFSSSFFSIMYTSTVTYIRTAHNAILQYVDTYKLVGILSEYYTLHME